MKICVEKNRILAKKLWREAVSVEKFEITRLAVMADHRRSRIGLFGLKFRRKVCLRFLLIDAGETRLTLDAFQDGGFERALAWLKESDWDIDAGIDQALEAPLIRVPISTYRRY